ncbi:translocation/assembly module TamB [Bacteroides fragilis]|jgi:hypothetical protein|nr:translocation/assembly module TamB [Bacteroides fragilis]
MIKVGFITNYFIFLFSKSKQPPIRTLKKTVRWVIGIILGIYIGTIILLNIPYIQRNMTTFVTKELSRTLGTELTIGKIDIGLLNRIIIDDVLLDDQSGKEMLKITRLSAKFDIIPLFNGKITISSVQLFGFNINLNKPAPHMEPNFKFVLDAFASKDTVKTKKDIDLRINSILIRRGKLSYDVLSEEETPGKFNPQHIKLHNIIANISLKALQNDSINAAIKRLSVDEQSGFELRKLSLKVIANNKGMKIENFAIEMPGTEMKMDTIRMEYDSLKALNHFADNVRFSFRTLPSHVTLNDISAFVPALSNFKEKLDLNIDVEGTLNQLNCRTLEINAGDKFRLKGDVSLQDLSRPQDAYVYGHLANLSANKEGIGFLVRNLSPHYNGVPPVLQHLGNTSFHGEISGYFTDLVMYGLFRTDIGFVQTDLKLSSDKAKALFSYSGGVKTTDFELGQLLGNKQLGKITFNLDVRGNHYKSQYPSITLKGLIASLEYSNYKYENITLDGEFKRGGFDGKVALNDENGSVHLNGNINVVEKVPTFNFNAVIDKIRPHDLNLTKEYPDAEFSLKLKANFRGGSIDEMMGEINIDSLQFTAPEKSYFLDNINITATRQDKENQLKLTSSFLKASIEGNYLYHTLPASVMNIMRRYIPSLIQPDKKPIRTNNNFSFDIHIFNTELLSTVFDIPLKIYSHSTVKGYFNDQAQRLRVEGYFPRLQYQNTFIESGLVLCENPTDQFKAKVRFNNLKKESAVSISLDAQAKNDTINANINWGNNAISTYSGRLSAAASFFRAAEEKSPLKTVVDIKQTDIILNDTLWQVHPSQVVVDSGKIDVNDFYFSHQDRHIRINGRISEQAKDTLKVELKDINVGYVFDVVSFDDVDFKGDATGTAYASGILKEPVMNTRLHFKNFTFNDASLGAMDIYGAWKNDMRAIFLDAHMEEEGVSKTHVIGHVYPLKPESKLDLNIETEHTNIQFLQYFMRSIVEDLHGRTSGKAHFYGKFKALNIEGSLMTDASLKIGILNTSFTVTDTIRLSTSGISFDNIRIADMEGHQGTMNGKLNFRHFRDLSYHFEFNVNNMLLMNTKENPDINFYGKVYGTGNAMLIGNPQELQVNAAVTTNRNTNFVYITNATASAASNQFIKFVDKTPRRFVQDSINVMSEYDRLQQEMEEEESKTDIRLNLLIDATPDATMKIIMDPIAGDYISGKGSGNIRTEFFNKGDVKMFGNYRINQGIYKFSLQEVIRKDFIIKDGSSITFNGPPLDATLDIQASYTVNSASLNDLIPDASETITQQPNVKVNCIMNLTGILWRPNIKLGIELPNERDEIQTLVRNYISTDEQMNMQILYLLGIGKFYPQESTGGTQNSNMTSSALFSTLSGQLNNLLSQVFDNNNWNIGTNLSTGDKGWTDMEIEGILSGQLLNNRLLINGNFGYRDNPLANTNFIGDFEAEWLLNRSGDIRLKAYNETNDRYYTRTNLTTQGIGIMYKKDFNKWSELLFWNKWKLRNLRRKQAAAKDSIPNDSVKETLKAKSEMKREHPI